MSLKTWKEEFYPIEAHLISEEYALSHSLRKWTGLRKENLEKHKCYLVRSIVHYKRERFNVDGETCALCEHYLFPTDGGPECAYCPLAQFGDGPCDESPESPYVVFLITNDPEPMIERLILCVEKENANASKIDKHP